MTQATFNQEIYKPVAMPGPFGYDGSVELPKLVRDSGNPNFLDGFPAAYGSPKSLGGQYITRAEMNGIGNVASRYEFFRRAGGISTFDAAFCAAIGGYPNGAILDYVYNGSLFKVESLADNNTVNFLDVGIDGINWRYLNVEQGDISASEIIAEIPVSQSPGSQLVTFFKAKRTGPLLIEDRTVISNDGSNSPVDTGNISNVTYYMRYGGYGIGILNLGQIDDPSSATIAFPKFDVTVSSGRNYISWNSNGWTLLTGKLSIGASGFESANVTVSGVYTVSPFIMWVQQGNMYALANLRGDTGKVYSNWQTSFGTNSFSVTYNESGLITSGSLRISYGKL